MTTLGRLAIFVMIALHPQIVSANETRHSALVISQTWARATPGGAEVGGGYLQITNFGNVADRLMGGTADIAAAVEIHEMKTANSIMTMRQLSTGLVIEAGQSVQLQPGGIHLMFKALREPLKLGAHFAVTLDFEKAGPITLDFHVEGIGAKASSERH